MKNIIIAVQFLLLIVFSYQFQSDLHDKRALKLEHYQITQHLLERNKHVPPLVAEQWATTIQQASQKYNHKVPVMLAVFKIESAMIHYSREGFITTSEKGAGGFGQVMKFWYKLCPHSNRPRDLDNASINIMCSAFVLRRYKDQNNNSLELGLTAYNGGPPAVKAYLKPCKKGPPHCHDFTNKYAKRVLMRV